MNPFWKLTPEHLLLEVHVVPRAAKSAVVGLHGGRLKVSLAAPPADGKANRELTELFARLSGRPRRAVALVRGTKSRQKTVAIEGLTREAAEAFLRALDGAAAAG
jgi:hypothetical protein